MNLYHLASTGIGYLGCTSQARGRGKHRPGQRRFVQRPGGPRERAEQASADRMAIKTVREKRPPRCLAPARHWSPPDTPARAPPGRSEYAPLDELPDQDTKPAWFGGRTSELIGQR